MIRAEIRLILVIFVLLLLRLAVCAVHAHTCTLVVTGVMWGRGLFCVADPPASWLRDALMMCVRALV